MRALIFGSISALAACVLIAQSGCATSINTPSSGGSGGEGGGSPSSSSGTIPDAGSDAPPGTCSSAAECASFGDACNTGACVNGKCGKLPANDFGACEDGLQCTENDTCQDGVCVGGTTKFCPATDTCSIGSCDLMLDACTEVPGNDGAPCNDDDACTLPGSCLGGVCNPGGMVDCSFLDGTCSLGYCDPAIGCKVMPQADGAPCNDNLFCTINDACNNGQCAGVPNTCAAPGDVCMIGSCDEANDKCTAVPGNNGAACDDGNLCTTGETCSNGICLGGVPANNGAQCDDDNGCSLGTTCLNGVCGNPTSKIMACINGDACCPPGCAANDNDCLYWQAGVQQNVPPAALVGWTQCYSGTYTDFSPNLPNTVLTMCNKAKLLMACRPTAQANWTLLAMAPRADVLFDCGSTTDCTKQSNGVGWYYSGDYSWGFAPGGLSVNRNSCDYNQGGQLSANLRLCWHTGGQAISSGYRCGDNDLNGGFDWTRAIFHAD